MNVGAVSKFGSLDGVRFESCAVSPFLDDQRIYVCYRTRMDQDLLVGERVLGVDDPVTATYPDRDLVSRVVLALETHFDDSKTQFFEFPQEAYRILTHPHLGSGYSGRRTNLAIALMGDRLVVFMSGGDGAGSYRINWEINVKERKVRRIVQAAEMNAVGETGQWLDLKEILEPSIILENKKANKAEMATPRKPSD